MRLLADMIRRPSQKRARVHAPSHQLCPTLPPLLQGILLTQGLKLCPLCPCVPVSPALAGVFFPPRPLGSLRSLQLSETSQR